MKKSFWSIGVMTAILMTSCGPSDDTTESPEVIQECYYTYNPVNTTLTWTAFKFNEKTPVSGTFNEVNINGAEVLSNPIKLIENLSFSIPVSTINTQNPERDEKIKNSFFNVLQNTSELTGRVESLNNGKAKVEIKMNDVKHVVEGVYTLEEGHFVFEATIDLTDFNALGAVESLNTLCKDLHVGADGVSKLWEVIDLRFETKLNMDCQ